MSHDRGGAAGDLRAQPGYEAETAGRLMTTEYVALKENQTAAVALEIVRRRARDTETIYSLVCH